MKYLIAILALASLLVLIPGLVQAQVPPPPDGVEGLAETYHAKHYSPYAGRSFPARVFWGDTHLHTALSFDAGAFGNRLGLEEAYRFARGEEVTTARPGRRYVELAQLFGEHGYVYSICNADWEPAISNFSKILAASAAGENTGD